jgi:hypothetical protein
MLLLALALASAVPQSACVESPKNLRVFMSSSSVQELPYTDDLGAHLRIADDFARYQRALKTADAELRANPKSELLFLLLRDPNIAIKEQTLARMMHKRVVPPQRLVDDVLRFWSYCDDERCVRAWARSCSGLQVRWARRILRDPAP